MNKKLMLLFMSIMLVLVLAACGSSDDQEEQQEDEDTQQASGETEDENSEAEEKGTLVMATSADYPPFESYNEDGEFIGFDIDLAHLIAEELGYELEIRDMDFNGLIGALQSERVDIVMAGMSATEDRKENVEFSSEYHYSGEMFVTQKGSDITSIEDIEGKTVGVQLGTIQEEGAKKLQEEFDFEIKPINQATTMIQELITGRIDIAYLDKTVAEGMIAEQDLAGFDDPTTSAPGMAVALPKGSELTEDISAAIDKFLEDGTIAELEEKWGLNE